MSESHRLLFLLITVFFFGCNLTLCQNQSDDFFKAYVQPGDINLGAIVPIGKTRDTCRPLLRSVRFWYTAVAIVFAVNKVNEDEKLLSGLKLGFAIVDSCSDIETAITQARRFYPPPLSKENRNESDGFDVVGVIAGVSSDTSEALNDLFSRNHIPQLSYWATSDNLNSDNYLYSYFLRTVPNNFMQMKAIVQFMARQGWSYFSVMYGKNSYGESSLKSIKYHIKSYSMCIDSEYELASDSNYSQIIINLVKHRFLARVVVLVGNYKEMETTFRTVYELGVQKKLIWIGTDGWAGKVKNLQPVYRESFLGSFTTGFYESTMVEFQQYIDSLKPSSSKDPWLKDIWQQVFNCSLGMEVCSETRNMSDVGFYIVYAVGYAVDAVFAFAQALDKLMREKCSGKVGREAAVCAKDFAQGVEETCTSTPQNKDSCHQYDLMLPYLKSVSFEGYTGLIEFDTYGNRKGQGKFTIKQIVVGNVSRGNIFEKPVRVIDGKLSGAIQKVGSITWKYVAPVKSMFGPNDRLAKTGHQEQKSIAPASVCSRLCEWGERKVFINIEKDCCWECHLCYPNEKWVPNSTECQQCPDFEWPDESTNFTTCIRIQSQLYIFSGNKSVMALLFMSSVGLSLTIAIIVCFIIYRRNRIIKASSRELSAIQLVAILICFMSNLFYITYQTQAACSASYFFVSVSHGALFSCTLMKNIRIYRLFTAAAKGKRMLKGVKPFSQIIIVLILMGVQCIICGLLIAKDVAKVIQHQPKLTEKYVEWHCTFGLAGVVTFIIWNFLLIILCALSAYKIRALPQAFRESKKKYITMLITSFIWISMIIFRISLNRKYLLLHFFAVVSAIHLLVILVCLHATRMFLVLSSRGRAHSQLTTRGPGGMSLKRKKASQSQGQSLSISTQRSSHN